MTLLDLLTPDTIAERFYTLPEELQAALEDKDNQREIQIACITNGIGDPEELRSAEAIMAAVLLGLTHMDDLGQTLVENLSLDKQDAEKIAAEVRTKVFEPFRKNIDKIYTPIIPEAKKRIATPPVAPAKIMDISAPIPTKTSTIAASMPAPMPMTPAPATSQAWQPTRLTIPGAAPIAPTTGTPAKPATPAVPAPFMMHQESSAEPLATGSDFKLNISKDMFKSTPTRPVEIPRPPKTAELEIGKAPLPPKPPGTASFRITPQTQSRVVHYTDLRTMASPGFGTARPPINVAPTVRPPETPAIKPIVAPTIPAAPVPPKAPKVVNFGPEEVK